MSSITQSVTPPVAGPAQSTNFSDAKIDDQTGRNRPENKKQTDFKTLITNSVDNVKKERKAKENGDLTSSSDAEFLDKLADSSKEKRQPKNELGKDDFLKLFVTQLQNQDPMNPDDGTEMAAKLAQFNGLEQMMNVNKGIEKLITAQGTDRNLQMINYIGKEVQVDGGRVRLDKGVPTKSEFEAPAPLAQATLEVRDGSGILVNQVDLGPMDAGKHEIKWDGKTHDGRQLDEGVFTYSITARNTEGGDVPIKLTSKAKINGVDIKNPEGALFSDFGRVTFDQIISVGKSGYDSVETPDAAKSLNPGGAPAGIGQVLNLPLPGSEPKPNSNPVATADNLDRLQAEGKLDLKKPGAVAAAAADAAKTRAAETKTNQEKAVKSAQTRAGAEANPGPNSAHTPPVAPAAAANMKKTVAPNEPASAKLAEPNTDIPAQAS
ncbi:MAG: flagellar hook assembly protein FlgD [Oligoflexus sp.]|nr:flagellar hook assembly protein FlgD [Oligoflexus sp.]